MATLTANPVDVLASKRPITPSQERRIRFDEDPVSDIFIVNRIAENLILSMFYQPEDFARFRYERNLELMEEEEEARRRRRPRCSMDLTRNNLSVPLAPRRQPTPAQAKIQRPTVIRTTEPCPVSPMRSLSPTRGSSRGHMRPGRSPRQLSPLRPCSRPGAQRAGAGGARNGKVGGGRPMALAA